MAPSDRGSVSIARHYSPGSDDERYARDLGLDLFEAIERFGNGRPIKFDLAVHRSTRYPYARLAVDPRASEFETWEAVVTTMQIGSAMFTAANAAEGSSFQCMINHKHWTVRSAGPKSSTSAGNWLTAFWLAIVCRDQTRMTDLCNIPIDLLRASGAQYDDYIYDWVDTLQTYWLQRPGLVQKLTTTIEKSDPSVATIAPRDLLNKVLYQPIALFHQFLRQNHANFNNALAEAITLHKQYWTAPDRVNSNEGYLALGPLAITCLAYDAGFPIEVETDYLPNALLERKWLGEFPT